MIKCIAIDMDGTLLNSSLKISEENISAIKKAQRSGIEVVITTGRSFPEVVNLLDEEEIKCSCICVNGAEVRNAEQEIMKIRPLEKKTARQVQQYLQSEYMYYEFFTNKGTYTVNMDEGVSVFENLANRSEHDNEIKMMKKHLKERLEFLKTLDSFELIYDGDEYHIYKLLAFTMDESTLERAREFLRKIDGIAVSSSGFNNVEVNSSKSTKGIALEDFVKEKGISLMETMAIGDNYNDLSMFERVGRSVAMGNADDEIKAQCDEVTLTNEENGVANAIFAVLEE
jgi:Cof subfamily protein (haloacid dehalogenase superfamily)